VWRASATQASASNKVREQQPAVALFSIGMVGLGALSVIFRDFAFDWQPVPAFLPGREALAVACGLFMIAASVALLFPVTVAIAARALLPFLLLWLCLKIPAVLAAPGIEGVWIGCGEIGMLLAGGWVLFARLSDLDRAALLSHLTGQQGIRISQIIFGLAVIPVGLGHLFYADITASLVPAWLPFRAGLAFLSGVGQIVCGLALLFSLLPRVAAFVETALITLFAFLVWGPDSWVATTAKLAGTPPGARFPLTAFLITWLVGASALLIATNSAGSSLTPLRDLLLSVRLRGRRNSG
jgi:uncharacterized membrane protein